jgi:alkanesulfonate monooxygenase SsuD/methylene tetrahydromethanopterin reductase-like flavin-dependent oxidoreductase (luciferase family)
MQFSAITLTDHSPAEFIRTARAAEAAGVERLWTSDHLAWRIRRSDPWFGSVPLLAAAAATTSRIRLGPLVATPNFRHPVPFAKEVMTLDHLSGGRIDLGIGAGTDAHDATVLGQDELTPRERAQRFQDWTQLLTMLLENDKVTATSGTYTAYDARMTPGCFQQPRVPLTIAAAGPRGMELAARLGQTWVTYGHIRHPAEDGLDTWLDGLHGQSLWMDAIAAEAEVDRPRAAAVIGLHNPAPFQSLAKYDDTIGRLAEAGFDDIYAHWPRADGTGIPRNLLEPLLDRHPRQTEQGPQR